MNVNTRRQHDDPAWNRKQLSSARRNIGSSASAGASAALILLCGGMPAESQYNSAVQAHTARFPAAQQDGTVPSVLQHRLNIRTEESGTALLSR